MAKSDPTASQDYQGKTEKVTDKARITGLLTKLLDSRGLLSVNLPGSKELYNSAIIEVHAQQGYLVVDELNPRSGHALLLKAGKMNIQTQLHGVDIRFDGLLESSDESDGAALYRVVFPSTLDYHQQRAFYRAKVSMARPIEVTLDRIKGETLSGFLNDISVGGIGIRFTTALPASLIRGERIPKCQIKLPTGEEIYCKLEIRFISTAIEGGHRLLGARFIQLTPSQEAAVARYVAALDRELAKNTPKE